MHTLGAKKKAGVYNKIFKQKKPYAQMDNTTEYLAIANKIKSTIPTNKAAIMNLLQALLTNSFCRLNSVTELSLNPLFKRSYSSISKALSKYYKSSSKKYKTDRLAIRESLQDIIVNAILTKKNKEYTLALDTTDIKKTDSAKLADRTNTYNGGNICSGHTYSALNLSAENYWSVPLSIERVKSSENKIEKSVEQIKKLLSSDKLSPEANLVIVADSAYNSANFLYPVSQDERVITITRTRRNKTFYEQPESSPKNQKGRKKQYGKKHVISMIGQDLEPSEIEEYKYINSKNKIEKIRLYRYKNAVLKSAKGYKMCCIKTDFVKIEAYDEQDSKKYKKDMYLQVSGERKDKLSLEQIYTKYKDRFAIEQFFKFSKQHLLLDKFQTSNVKTYEDFVMFCGIAYGLMFLLRNLITMFRTRQWYRPKDNIQRSPSNVFRSLPHNDIIRHLENGDIKKRGIPGKRNIRKTFTCREDQPIVKKNSDSNITRISITHSSGNRYKKFKTPKNVVVENVLESFAKILKKYANAPPI